MKQKDAKFMVYDWDEGKMKFLPSNNIVEAIYMAWNYEFDVYEVATEGMIFSGKEDNETNSEMLESYGVRLIDDGDHRKLQSVFTGEIYSAEWQV